MNRWRFFAKVLILPSLFLLFFETGERPVNAQTISYDALLTAPKSSWPPKGQRIKSAVTRDTWISSEGDEKIGNNGKSRRLKVKGRQEYILFDIDPSALKGKIITGALLHIRSATPVKAPLARLGISTLATGWVEGTSRSYRPQEGSSCYIQAAYKKRNWSYPGSTLMDVVFGRGRTIWKFADCSPPNELGWQTCAVDLDVVVARMAGLSYGFCAFDDVGSIWSLKKGTFKYIKYPNRFCYSKESGKSAPWMEVWVEGVDSLPPETVKSINVEIDALPAGEALIRWKSPKDNGGGKTLGFHVTYTSELVEKSIPRYLIPMAGKAGEEVKMHIRDLTFQPGEVIDLTIKPVDSAGNIGKPYTRKIRLSSNPRSVHILEADIKHFPPHISLPTVGGLKVAVVDLLDKIDPITGKMIPSQKEGYKGGNHIYSANKKLIRLQAARNEHVAFQLNLEGKAEEIFIKYVFNQNPNLLPKIFEFAYVKEKKTKEEISTILPDPLIQLNGHFSIPSNAGKVTVPNQTNHSLICELYVPHEELSGKKKGKVTITVGKQVLELDVDLTVWDFTLPNKLSFIPEMNAYGLIFPFNNYDYYRLAHVHRTCVNRLPYGWKGSPYFAPKWKGEEFDWSEWDQNIGPLLDGSAFEDLPRRNEPVDVLYLPLTENWPVSIFENYKPSYWADEAFAPQYGKELKKAFSAFARHFEKKKWHDTIFQFYLNNKVYRRKNYNKSSAPWVFDEPINTQDFWALRWYGILWRSAVDHVDGNSKMWYRGDISYSQFERDMFRGVMDIEYIGGNNAQKTRMKNDEQILWGKSYFSEYGTANPIKTSNIQPTAWCLSAWSKDAMGVLPWQTIGNESSWKIADQTSLFYPHAEGPKPSVRLKAFTRGQQDVEYLTIFCDVFKKPRYAVTGWLNKVIDLKGSVYRSSLKDAGTAEFDILDTMDLWELRYRVGKMISDKGPKYKRALIDWETPVFDMKNLPDIGYVPVSPQVQSYKPDCDDFGH